ncbi:hypothetical protein Sjap_022215 [Stephania japonica]|uniref:Uncharacterized protein n=1 Tax=Stephania japonica TaxID=461633 RepID=A0AAP0HPN8_9MAGN
MAIVSDGVEVSKNLRKYELFVRRQGSFSHGFTYSGHRVFLDVFLDVDLEAQRIGEAGHQTLDKSRSPNSYVSKVPDGLQKRFGDNSFAGNAALCGSSPLPDCLLHHLQQHLLKLCMDNCSLEIDFKFFDGLDDAEASASNFALQKKAITSEHKLEASKQWK